jgi:hypothetical protein
MDIKQFFVKTNKSGFVKIDKGGFVVDAALLGTLTGCTTYVDHRP